MKNELQHKLILPPWIWLRRLPYRCGYGVHSPYAFDFITGVIYERGEYYAYKQLDELLPLHVSVLNLRPRRILRLLFRLANFSEARKAAVIGHAPLAFAYLKAALPNCQWTDHLTSPTDLIYIADSQATAGVVPQAKIIIIDHLLQHRQLFEDLQKDTRTTLSFDLYDLGIIMQQLALNRMHYLINF